MPQTDDYGKHEVLHTSAVIMRLLETEILVVTGFEIGCANESLAIL